MTQGPKVLTIDLETSPALVWTWSLWKPVIGIEQVEEPTRMICFTAAWETGKVMFHSEWTDGTENMLDALYALLSEADVVQHWNGTSFDEPHIRRELLEAGYPPLPPFKTVDLMQWVKRNTRFLSNKLDWVAQRLLADRKKKHEGFTLWLKVLRGDPVAQKRMEVYAKQDTALTRRLGQKLRPYIASFPHAGLYTITDDVICRCGSDNLERRGAYYAKTFTYQRYRCRDCGAWNRGRKNVGAATTVGV